MVRVYGVSRKERKGRKGEFMTEEQAKENCDKIRQIAYELHVYLGVGYLEKVYENGSEKFQCRKIAKSN